MKKALIFALASTLLLLSGCFLEIRVPVGGSVVSQSGAYDCDSFCSVPIWDLFFDETFEAVPDRGYGFVGWKKAELHFCGGKTTPCYLSTSQFADYPALMDMLSSNSVFYLEPEFVQNGEWDPGLAGRPVIGDDVTSCVTPWNGDGGILEWENTCSFGVRIDYQTENGCYPANPDQSCGWFAPAGTRLPTFEEFSPPRWIVCRIDSSPAPVGGSWGLWAGPLWNGEANYRCDPDDGTGGGGGGGDADGDGRDDSSDNCPNVSNPGQGDADGDGVGDLCDTSPNGGGTGGGGGGTEWNNPHSTSGNPCITAVQRSRYASSLGEYEHQVQATNHCNAAMYVSICYKGTDTCSLPTVPAGQVSHWVTIGFRPYESFQATYVWKLK
jgi:Thrombospondin type 3 repeat